jgi:hypothetical protein
VPIACQRASWTVAAGAPAVVTGQLGFEVVTGAGRGAAAGGAGAALAAGDAEPAGVLAAVELPPGVAPDVPPADPAVGWDRWMMITTWRRVGATASVAATTGAGCGGRGVAVAEDTGSPTVNSVTRPTRAAALNPRARIREAAAG